MTKELKPSSRKKTAFSTNGAGSTGSQHVEEYKLIHSYLPFCTKLKSKWIKDLHRKSDTLNLVEEKVRKSLELIGIEGIFLNRISMAQALRSILINGTS